MTATPSVSNCGRPARPTICKGRRESGACHSNVFSMLQQHASFGCRPCNDCPAPRNATSAHQSAPHLQAGGAFVLLVAAGVLGFAADVAPCALQCGRGNRRVLQV